MNRLQVDLKLINYLLLERTWKTNKTKLTIFLQKLQYVLNSHVKSTKFIVSEFKI